MLVDKPLLGADTYLDPHFADGLVANWLMNEGGGDTLVNVANPGTYDGIFSGSVLTWAGGKFGPCIDLPGTDEYYDCGDINELDGVTRFTMGGWFRRGGVSTFNGTSKSTDANNSVFIGFDSDLAFYSVGSGVEAAGDYASDDLLWHQLFLAYDGNLSGNANRCKGFFDGEQVTLDFKGSTIPASTPTMTGNFRIGRDQFDQYALGNQDNIALWDYPLLPSQIKQLYLDSFWGFRQNDSGIYTR